MNGLQQQSHAGRSSPGKIQSATRWIAATAAASLWVQTALAAPPTTPTGLDAVTGGDSIVLMWAGSTGDTAITRYNVYRDGVRIGTSSASNPGTVYKRGTRFTDWEISRGGSYSYQVQAIDGNGAVSELSAATLVTAPTDTTSQPEVAIDTSLAPDLASWANQYVLPEVLAWYPKISNLIAYPDYTPRMSFTIQFDPSADPAYADWRRGLIVVDPEYARKNPQDLGMFIHEFTHIVQSPAGFARGWIIEGTADWTREHIYKDRPPIVPKATDSYVQGYSQGSLLLEYFRQRARPDSVRKTNVALHNGTYHDGVLTNLTRFRSLDDAWLSMLNVPGHDIRTGSITAALAGKCLDNYAFGTDDGNPIGSWVCTGTDNQYFSAVLNSDGTYAVRVHGKCLNVSSAGTANGTPVELHSCNWTSAQRWQMVGSTLKNPSSGRCLDAGDLDAGGQTRIWDCNGSSAQQWNIAVATPTGSISAVSLPNKCAENRNGKIVVGTCGADGQEWTVVPVGGNVVLTVGGGACMDVTSSGTTNGTPIQSFRCNGTLAQQWTVISSGLLRNPNSGRCLAANDSGNDGTPFVLSDCNTRSVYQRWHLPGQTMIAVPAQVTSGSVRITNTP